MSLFSSHPDRYAVAGNPIAHSQSPFIHAQFALATGQNLAYGRLLCPLDPPEAFAATLRRFAEGSNGTDGTEATDDADATSPARGCNVTVPFKFKAFALATRHTERARLAQAANTLRFDAEGDDTGWLADNTDGAGLVRDIVHNAGVALAGQRVLLVGAGGAAAGALGPLIGARPAAIGVANRTLANAATLVERHQAHAAQHGVALAALTLAAPGERYDVVVNASASSLAGAAIPVPAGVLRPGALALDMMYGPAAQPFLQWAAANGATARDGLGMLVEQAAEAFQLWRGIRPDTAAVLAALRQRMAAA